MLQSCILFCSTWLFNFIGTCEVMPTRPCIFTREEDKKLLGGKNVNFRIYFMSEGNHQNDLREAFPNEVHLCYQTCFFINRRFFHILCLTKMLFYVFKGVEEFIDHGITPDKLLIGIPWHGYDYTCVNYTTNVSECTILCVE